MTSFLHRRFVASGVCFFVLLFVLLIAASADHATAGISAVGGDAVTNANNCESPTNIDNRIWTSARQHNANACAILESNNLTIPAGGVGVGVFLPRRDECRPTNPNYGWHVADEADSNGLFQSGTIPAGWNVDVHLIHANRVGESTAYPWNNYDGYVRFDEDIIGVIMGSGTLDETDFTLGRRRPELDPDDRWAYPTSSIRGLEFNNAVGSGSTQAPDGNKDWVRTNCAADQQTQVYYPRLNFHLEVAEGVDQVRVVTINYADFQVFKNFSPVSPVQPHPTTVTISLTCGTAAVENIDTGATETDPADFRIRDFNHDPTPTCTATEAVPPGYIGSGSPAGRCAADLVDGDCTITNTERSATFRVSKDFIPNNAASVAVTLSCTSGYLTTAATQNVTEATPYTWTVKRFNDGATCTATEALPLTPPHTADQANCASRTITHNTLTPCTITNTQHSYLTVNKVCSPPADPGRFNLRIDDTVRAANAPCAGTTGTVLVSPGLHTVSETAGLNTTLTNYTAVIGGDCAASGSVTLLAGEQKTCTITNTLNPKPFKVEKDFSDGNPDAVQVALTCTPPATVAPSGQQNVSELTPYTWTVSNFTSSTTCTAIEDPVAGYTSTYTCSETLLVGGCKIYNYDVPVAFFLVRKDFSDNSTASVNVTLDCGPDATVTPASAPASESTTSPHFTVTGYTANTQCEAQEAIQDGYIGSGLPAGSCAADLLPSPGSCTITNTLREAWVRVTKHFSDNNLSDVFITLTCGSGTVESDPPSDHTASETDDAMIRIYGFDDPATCSVSEQVPLGYTVSYGSGCGQTGGIAIEHGQTYTCPITNNLIPHPEFTVHKDFVPNSSAIVNVTLQCATGTPSPAGPQPVSESTPFTWTVVGAAGDPMCTASEEPIPNYDSTGECSAPLSAGECTITNIMPTPTPTPQPSEFTVYKDFSDDSTQIVDVTLVCDGATVSPSGPQQLTETDPYTWTVSGAGDPECTATEDPDDVTGYDTTGQCSAPRSTGECTIVNNKVSTFSVNKDFQPDAPGATVTVYLQCDVGTVTPPSASASEGSAAAFRVSEFTGDPVCTASESDVPAPYYAGGTCSANLSQTSCTIVNSTSVPPSPLPPLPVGGTGGLVTDVEGSGGNQHLLFAVASGMLLGALIMAPSVLLWRRSRE